MPSLTILADDLTGACDTGTLFAGPGPVPVTVWPDPPAPGAVRAVDTESRGLPAEAARQRVRAAVQAAPADRYFKKIDSTLRGWVGAEIEAVMDETGISTALVCPAFPAQGRTVVDRVLLVDGRPLMETAFARDVQAASGAGGARRSSSVVEILRAQITRAVAWIPLTEVRGDLSGGQADEPEGFATAARRTASAAELSGRLARLAGTVTIADAETDEDLDALVAAALELDSPPLLAGSAGLGAALARRLGRSAEPVPLPRGEWLILVGSLHPASRRQVERSREAGLRVLATEDPPGNPPGPITPEPAAVERLATQAVNAISTLLDERGARGQPGSASPPGSLLVAVTGGETAVALYRALGGTRLDLVGAPAPGLALSQLHTPDRPPIWLLTKAGGFGPPELFVHLASTP